MSKAVIFMGTPHRGADAASWASVAARALGAIQVGTVAPIGFLSDLKKNSQALRHISQEFVERTSTLKITTFYETKNLDHMSFLVHFH